MGKKSAAMHNQTYLQRREGTYYFRAKIPKDLRPFPYRGNTYPIEYKRSLQTKDRAEALRLLRKEILEITTAFEKHRDRIAHGRGDLEPRKVMHLDQITKRQLATRWLHELLAADEDRRRDAQTIPDLAKYVAETKKIAKHANEAMQKSDTSFVANAVETALGLFGAEISIDEKAYKELEYEFLKAAAIYGDTLSKRNKGAVVETDEVAPEHAAWTLPARRPGGDSLGALLEHWVRAVPNRRETTAAAFRSTTEEFAIHVHNKAPSTIARSDLISYRDHLRDAVKLHPNTIEKKLTFLNAIFQRAVDDGLLPANPAARIKVPKPKVPDKSRLPYSRDDITKIFASPLYARGHRPRGCGGEAAVWLPLLGLFTGARLEELGQLNVDDIKRDHALGWYIEIGFGEGQRVKTVSSRRRIPVHADLIRAGFLRYRDGLLLENETKLFPALRPDVKGDRTGNWSKWWGRYARRVIGITDKRKVFHSTRHSFKLVARACEIAEDVHDALTGHVGGGVGRKYGGEEYPLAPLFAAMQRYYLPDVTVPVVVPDDDASSDAAARVAKPYAKSSSRWRGKTVARAEKASRRKSSQPTSRKKAKPASVTKSSRKRAA